MILVRDIISEIERFAPPQLQEDYDNSGLQLGDRNAECTGVLLCVDVTPAVVDEAVSRRCNLIVSHHPLLFRGLKRIVGASPVEISVMKALASGISVYSCHTSADNATHGVSWMMARKLGLSGIRVLEPQPGKLMKLVTMVPDSHVESVSAALFDAGAGKQGNYDRCRYTTKGEGTFRALDGANPYVGGVMQLHHEPETRLEVLLPTWRRGDVEQALCDAHPYEEPAYDFIRLDNRSMYTGSGAIGEYESPVTVDEFVSRVKDVFSSPVVRCTTPPAGNVLVKSVAMCGGAGSFLLGKAVSEGAQVYVTSDTRYHDFVDYADRIFIVDIGHFEGEQCTKEIFYHVIKEKFPTFALYYSDLEKNPINYL